MTGKFKATCVAAVLGVTAVSASAEEFTIGLSNGWVGSEWRTQMIAEAEEAAKAAKPEADKAEAEKAEGSEAAAEAKADAPAEEAATAEPAAEAPAETGEAPAVETDADGDELVEVKYFVRVDRRKRGGGQNRGGQRGPRQDARGKGGPKGKGGNRPNQGGKGGRGGKPGGGRNQAPEKANQINEDSPFAKLKEMLEAKG